jgi:hypothetical protein
VKVLRRKSAVWTTGENKVIDRGLYCSRELLSSYVNEIVGPLSAGVKNCETTMIGFSIPASLLDASNGVYQKETAL